MKYNTQTNFKNGMVSPRLRSKLKEGDTGNAAEKIENFIVDRTGGLVKRSSLEFPLRQPFKSSTYGAATFDNFPVPSSTTGVEYFSVSLKGRNFQFRFKTTNSLNSIKSPISPSTVAHYQSNFLDVVELLPEQPSVFLGNAGYKDVRPFAPYTVGTPVLTNNPDLTTFLSSPGAGSTFLAEYIYTCTPMSLSMAKVTDATVVFVSRGGVSHTVPSFTVSLLNLPITSGSTTTTEVFVILPYFISVKGFVSNLGKATSAIDYYCPLHPSNFPFNAINTNPAFTITATVFFGQSNADGTNGVLSNNSNKLVYGLTLPIALCADARFPYGTSTDSLVGKYLLIPSTNSQHDVAFFITAFRQTVAGIAEFYAIRVTAGDSIAGNPYAPAIASTQWKISTFGGQAHPKTVNFFQNRLIYGNNGIDKSRWWASGVHPTSITNFQGFMGFNLAQDIASDVSKMGYDNVAQATIQANYQNYGVTDPYRWGFTDRVPNLSAISFIESRSKLHFGTLAGETQLIVGNGNFAKASYDQTIIRTNSASLMSTTRGDGKFFYISNGGKDIRFISTEDKYYESLDGLMTTALEGLGLVFRKIEWYEKLNSIVAITITNRIFLITVHEDTQIKAVIEIKSELGLLDFFCNLDDLYIVVSHKGYQLVSRYLGEQSLAGDFALVHDGYYSDYSYTYPSFLGDTIYIFYNGIEYTLLVPADGSTPTPPVDPLLATGTNPIFVYGKKVMAKLKTPPLLEGGGNNSAVGDVTRVDRATIQIDNSGPFKIGNEGGTIYDVEGQLLTTMQTKYVNFNMPQSDDIENHLYIETDKPTPLNISGIVFRGMSKSGE